MSVNSSSPRCGKGADSGIGTGVGTAPSVAVSPHFSRTSSLCCFCNDVQPQNFANVEDMLFEVFRCEETDSIDSIAIGQFLKALEATGLRKSDPRLKEMVANIEKYQKNCEFTKDIKELVIGRKQFKMLIFENIVLIARGLRHQFIIPDFVGFTRIIEDIFESVNDVKEGKTADYIPQLAKQDPDHFGISICTIDGQRFSIGSCTVPFTLQSCCKPLNYAIALNELGADVVHDYIGQEPSGRKFNDLDLDYNKKPHNPMVNSGSIMINALLQNLMKPEMSLAEKFDYINDYIKRMSGNEYLSFNNSVFLAEREVSDRNYALSYYMKENNCFPKGSNIKDVLDFWYQCCSMEVTCETLAVIGATFANGGVCPTTRERVIKSDAVRDVLSLLHSCGFYEYSGQFAFKYGLPGKSSKAGAMMMVLPNTMGICIYSPLLDQFGNSVKGLAFCQELVRIFNFHRYDNNTKCINKINPRRVLYESKGETIVNLMYSAAEGDIENLKRHMLLGHNMNVSDFDGRTPLHLSAAEGHFECVKFLLNSCEVRPDPKDRWGHTPQSEAERFGHHKVADYLQWWTVGRDDSCDTLTAKGGAALLKKLAEINIQKQNQQN